MLLPTVKVFTTGNSQAVRLPKAFRVNTREMWITKNEVTGEIVLRPKDDDQRRRNLATLFKMIEEDPFTEDFIPEPPITESRNPLAVDLLLAEMPTLPWTTAAADHYGQVKALLKRKGMPIGEMDTQIAAHALAEDLILVTHNSRHFKSIPGLKIEDWVA